MNMERKRRVWLWVVVVSLLLFLLAQLVTSVYLVMIGGQGGLGDISPQSLVFVQALSIVIMFGGAGWILRRVFLNEKSAESLVPNVTEPLSEGTSLRGKRSLPVKAWLLWSVVGVVMAGQFFIGWTSYLNQQIHLPAFLSGMDEWMRSMEQSAKVLTEKMMEMRGGGDMLWVLLCLGVVPGVFEEFYFRGMIQPLVYRSTGNKHWAVWGTAILFSAIHLQFLGFIPRLLLALFFGYLVIEGAPLWLAMLAHGLNNSIVVVFSYMDSHQIVSRQVIERIEQGDPWWVNLLLTTAAVGLLVFMFRCLKVSVNQFEKV